MKDDELRNACDVRQVYPKAFLEQGTTWMPSYIVKDESFDGKVLSEVAFTPADAWKSAAEKLKEK